MTQQPLWKISIPRALEREAVEELLAKTATSQQEGTGLQVERLDVSDGSTELFVSGADADAQMLVARIGERPSQRAGRVKRAACTVEELQRTGAAPKRRPKR
jgi:hypothetical protein